MKGKSSLASPRDRGFLTAMPPCQLNPVTPRGQGLAMVRVTWEDAWKKVSRIRSNAPLSFQPGRGLGTSHEEPEQQGLEVNQDSTLEPKSQGNKAGTPDSQAESNGGKRSLRGQREGPGVGEPLTPALAGS